MDTKECSTKTKEFSFSGFRMSGFLALFLHLIVFTAAIVGGFFVAAMGLLGSFAVSIFMFVLSLVLSVVWLVLFAGYMQLEPNEARAMVFFGKYRGTFKETGFFWVNPFLDKKKLSLRARNLDVEPIKVNDKIGNPILIGLVLVWKLKDTYKAMFEIDSQTMAASASTTTNANQISIGNAVANRMNAFENFVKI
ncbi:MAG: SPFH domain-containing protein, partial [Bacteroides sp.]|nr:SPFH domain-containing protein [Bacteroides sp.]